MSTNSKPQIVTDDHALAARINRIGQMPPRELREAYRHAFGRETTSGNRAWLVRTISNRLREIEESHQQPQALAMARVVVEDRAVPSRPVRRQIGPLPRPRHRGRG